MCRPMIWTGGKSLQNQNLSDLSGQIPSIQELLAEERNASDRIQKLDGDIAHLRKSILLEWLGQARRLWIAAERHRLKGKHFSVFAMQIGIDRSSAYELLKLHPHRAEISKRCRCANHWPGWEVVAGWYKGDKNHMADTDLDRPATRNKGLLTPTWQRRKVSDDEYGTPQALFDHYDRIHHFTCDVAASAALAKCEKFFDKATDGLAQTWTGVYWMNPPYGADDDRKRQLGRWVHKAHEASQQGGVVVVALLPVFTDAAWFHNYASHAEIEFLKGKLQFEGRTDKGYSPFGHMICVFRQQSARQGKRLSVVLNGHRLGTSSRIAPSETESIFRSRGIVWRR